MNRIYEIIKYFPVSLSKYILKLFEENQSLINEIQEIKIRASAPVILKFRNSDLVSQYVVNSEEILHILERFCENSIYAYKNQICQGFLTIKGGHRIGITGSAVLENNSIINIKYISSLNIRIAKEILNCGNSVLKEIIDKNNKTIFNSLIVSPPGKGKTTVLRDVVRQISNGIEKINFKGKTIGLVDERGEIAACYKGVPQNDVGIRTDIIGNIDKAKGINMLIRSMAPEIIACDEIGGKEDIIAIRKAMISGVKGIFTMHGKNIEDIKNNNLIYELVEEKQIEKIIFI